MDPRSVQDPVALALALIATGWSEARAAAGLSVEQAAALIQITGSGLYKIERGESFPRAETIMRAAHTYGVTPNDLLPVDYSTLVDTSWLEPLGRRSQQSLPQGRTAELALASGDSARSGKGSSRRSSTRSTAAGSTTRQAAGAAGSSSRKGKTTKAAEVATPRYVGRVDMSKQVEPGLEKPAPTGGNGGQRRKRKLPGLMDRREPSAHLGRLG